AHWLALPRPAAPIITLYIQLFGRRLAEPNVAADTIPPLASPPLPNALGRNGARCDFTAHGPTPGPPPPCGMQKVLCRLRCDTSEPQAPGLASPTMAFMLAPSVYTWPPLACTISHISTMASSKQP